jgi:hypothetical protein
MALTLRRTQIRQAPIFEGVRDFTVYDYEAGRPPLPNAHSCASTDLALVDYSIRRAAVGAATSGTAATLDGAKVPDKLGSLALMGYANRHDPA